MTTNFTSAQLDRVCGVLLGSAAGDALGAGYEFGSAPYSGRPEMIGGGLGGFAPGEWTDDTSQAMAIARVAATGADLRDEAALDAIAAGFAEWFAGGPSDVGIQTSQVLRLAGPDASAATMRDAARAVHERSGRSAGNGSLMRTAPVALANLDDPQALVEAALAVSALTHHDPMAGEVAALWCLMIRHTVLTGEFPTSAEAVTELEHHLGRTGCVDWRALLNAAEEYDPSAFTSNAWVVGALQAAWSAIVHTPVPGGSTGDVPDGMRCLHLQDALATAIGIGHDTDTVAAIAGALLGARWGGSAVPQEWQELLHGWGMTGSRGAADLVRLALLTAQGGRTATRSGWPACERMEYRGWGGEETFVPHPTVDGVWIGGALPVESLPAQIDAVVSLCRMGTAQVPEDVSSHVVRLVDTEAEDNPNLHFVVDDAARTVLRLRAQGRGVYLHCVASHSRTPTVAIRVAVLAGASLEEATRAVVDALPAANPRTFLRQALEELSKADETKDDA
ncbi:ADP-ribosylglycohydrolase family protein [Nocardioides yefusunii]|uniref:ADP-ribosylglycohydrolase family protein n=1 Tax=Nocardioides yefusunii TaxID=2500546 RepID=A0ABW1QZB0_9ACTN|nr:ADP-ribosylglycohydrolase family protein [Nocardioides yefusunii]